MIFLEISWIRNKLAQDFSDWKMRERSPFWTACIDGTGEVVRKFQRGKPNYGLVRSLAMVMGDPISAPHVWWLILSIWIYCTIPIHYFFFWDLPGHHRPIPRAHQQLSEARLHEVFLQSAGWWPPHSTAQDSGTRQCHTVEPGNYLKCAASDRDTQHEKLQGFGWQLPVWFPKAVGPLGQNKVPVQILLDRPAGA